MIVYILGGFAEYECILTPQMLYSICEATKTGDVHCLVRLEREKRFCYFGAEKIDTRRTFTDKIMANIACPLVHTSSY